jgi:uncharacterized membrane protein
LLAAGLALCSGAAVAKPITYTYASIIIPNSAATYVSGINASGTVVGEYYDSSYLEHGFIYQGGTVTSFDAPGAANGTTAIAIKNDGTVVGSYYDANYVPHGYIYTPATSTFTTVDMPGASSTTLGGVDTRGVVFGVATEANNTEAAFSYIKNKFTTLPINGSAVITSVSEKGSLAGYFFTFPTTPLYYANGAVQTIPLTAPNGATATGVNAKNTVIGNVTSANYQSSGFVYANGVVTPVTQPGAASTTLSGLNDKGTIVGNSYDSSYKQTSFVYSKGIFTTIAVPGGSNTSLYGISKTGVLIGTYTNASYNQFGFVATPMQ